MRKKLSLEYFFKSIVFIVEQFSNAITDTETAKTRKIKILKNF